MEILSLFGVLFIGFLMLRFWKFFAIFFVLGLVGMLVASCNATVNCSVAGACVGAQTNIDGDVNITGNNVDLGDDPDPPSTPDLEPIVTPVVVKPPPVTPPPVPEPLPQWEYMFVERDGPNSNIIIETCCNGTLWHNLLRDGGANNIQELGNEIVKFQEIHGSTETVYLNFDTKDNITLGGFYHRPSLNDLWLESKILYSNS